MPMLKSRVLILSGIAALMAVVLVWKWVAGWGLVTLNVRDVPLAQALKSIERQGRVKIVTNADPSTPVTMLVEKVSAYDAIDTLALAIDADTRLAYVAAPDSRQIKNVLAAYAGGSNPGGWTVFAGGFGGRGGGPREQGAGNAGPAGAEARPREPQQTAQQPGQNREPRASGDRGRGDMDGGGFGGWAGGETLTDPRLISWKPSESEDKSLHGLLNQGSQKTGALFAAPEGWNPLIGKLPREGRTGKVTVSLIKSAKGAVEEVFLLTVQPPRPQTAAAEDGGRWEFTRTVFTPQRGGGRNPEWMAERVRAQIAALPEAQQAEAKKQMDEMRAFWESIRSLPEADRRAKMEEMMNRPEVQERMEERMNARDNKTTPQKREERMRRYIERKNQIKGQPTQS